MTGLTPEHISHLEKHAIDIELARSLGVYSATTKDEVPEQLSGYSNLPALVFPWKNPEGHIEYQVRPDSPNEDSRGRLIKYRFRSKKNGYRPVLWAVREPGPDGVVLITEGTQQTLAVASYAPPEMGVYGIGGCRQWSTEGLPIDDLAVVEGRTVIVILDADAEHNREVYDAGMKLASALKLEGATKVLFARLPSSAGSKEGIDDILASKAPDRRAGYLQRVIRNAKAQPADSRPPAKGAGSTSGFIEPLVGLRTEKLTRAVLEKAPAALTPEDKIAMYENGVYVLHGRSFVSAVTALLKDDYRTSYRSAAEEFAVGLLHQQGLILPDRMDQPLLNLKNGMLDLETGKLHDHDPKYLSSIQLPVEWHPDAPADLYEAWIESIGMVDQLEDLEEVTSTMLDPTHTPPKALFAFGQPRTGKSTYLRIMTAVAGGHNTSAVTLHQLSTNKFAAANVYGKILNAANDLSSAEVQDLSLFKMMTGEDSIQADRKYGKQFVFTNRALFAFSANELPPVNETSTAYLQRMKPFLFNTTFAGHEDPRVEDAILTQLPGILVRWVRAWQRKAQRGTYLPTAPAVSHEFQVRSDRVRQWVFEQCRVTGGGSYTSGSYVDPADMMTKADLARAFGLWAAEQGTPPMGLRKIIDRLLNIPGVVEVRSSGGPGYAYGTRGLNVTVGIGDVDGADVTDETPPTGRSGNSNISPARVRDDDDDGEGVVHKARIVPELPDLPVDGQGGVRAHVHTDEVPPQLPELPAAPRTVFDLETASADDLYSYGEGFVRLGGFTTPEGRIELTTDGGQVARAIERSQMATGHNIIGFDLQALHRYHGLDMFKMIDEGRVFDTLLVARHIDPPMARDKGVDATRKYDLDTLGEKYGLGHKAADLKALAKQFGGYDLIPTDDERYRQYMRGDVALSAAMFDYMKANFNVDDPYIAREHRVAGLAARISLNGFRLDLDLLAERIAAGEERKQKALRWLAAKHGIPLNDPKGKPYSSPLTTKLGKAALEAAFERLGIKPWRTEKTGDIQINHEALVQYAHNYHHDQEIRKFCKAIDLVVTTRSVYTTIEANRVGDRVHPKITMGQSTGRWSSTRPGLTTIGKRGGRHIEREVFLPDPGELILAVDLAQVDMRAVAGLSQDPAYIEVFRSGRDPHTEIALQLFGRADMREKAKAIGHGWNYSEGLRKISESNEIDPRIVRQFDTQMREQFPGIVRWQEESREMAASGELLDNGFGRPMRPDPARAHTQGPALRGQGAARDIMMEGMLRLPPEVLPMLRAQVHDEIVLSVPEADAEDIRRAVVDALSFEWEGVPIVADSNPPRHNWGAVYEK